MKTFKCDFGRGIICTVLISDSAPAPGNSQVLEIQWQGAPTSRLLRPYVAWMNSVNQQLADEWNATVTHVFLTGSTTSETWCFEPGGKPTRIAVNPSETEGRTSRNFNFDRQPK